MALETFTIELRVDFNDASKNELVVQAMRMAAKHVLTTAMLLQDKRPPQIALMTSNLFERDREISLADDIPADEPATTPEAPTDAAV